MGAFHEERKALVKKYALLTAPLLSKREALLKGAIDVKEEDGQVVEKPVEAAAGEGEEGETSPPKGIPNFWLRTLMSHRLIAGMVQEEDVGALKYLRDVECVDKEDGAGFSLHFHFAQPNPYFTNPVLSKAYEVPNLMDDEEAILQACAGTAIHWVSPKQNLCMEEKRMKPKGKSRGGVVVKQIKKESFFNWFEAVDIPEDPEDVEEEEYEELMGKVRREGREGSVGIGSDIQASCVPTSFTIFGTIFLSLSAGLRLCRRLDPAGGDCAGGDQVVPGGGGGGRERVRGQRGRERGGRRR